MKLAILAFTRRGCALAERIEAALSPDACRRFTMEKFGLPGFEPYAPPLAEFTEPVFRWADTLVFVGSTGMAVRAIAPWVRDKKTDPAVIVVDEGGSFAVSLLSGHIGGANAQTLRIAKAIGAQPVITTATDVSGKFSVDAWAAENGAVIGSMALAKAVAAEILERDVPMVCDFPVSELPSGVIASDRGELGIYIGYRDISPFPRTLQLIPRALQLGIGCRRGTGEVSIEAAVNAVLRKHGIRREAIAMAASIDLKSDEPGLLAFCEHWGLPVRFYTVEQLQAVPGQFPKSSFVQSVTGVDNVCQRAALLGAEKIIVEKTAVDGVTVSLAQRKWEAVF